MPGGQGRLLIRGGTSSVGMAAASIASGYGVKIAATTRRQSKIDALTAAGVDYALLDDGGSLTASLHAIWPEGPDYVLDLVGARHGGGLAAAGPPWGDGVRDGLAQRVADPRTSNRSR